MHTVDGLLGDEGVNNVKVHVVLDAPVHPFVDGPILITGEHLHGDVGVVTMDEVHDSWHERDDDHLVGETFLVNEVDQGRNAVKDGLVLGLGVAVDGSAHFHLDDGHDVVLDADVEEFAQGARIAGIGDAVTLAGQPGVEYFLGCHFGNLGRGSAQALVTVVVADDKGAVGGDAYVTFQRPSPGFGTVDKGSPGIFHTPLRAAMSYDELSLHAQCAHDDEGSGENALEQCHDVHVFVFIVQQVLYLIHLGHGVQSLG